VFRDASTSSLIADGTAATISKAVHRFAHATSRLRNRRHHRLLDVLGRAQPEHDAVRQLAGNLQHPVAQRRDQHGRIRPHRGQAGKAVLDVVPLAGVTNRSGVKQGRDHLQVLTHERRGMVEVQAQQVDHGHPVAHANTEVESPAGEGVDPGRLVGHGGGVARKNRQYTGSDAHGAGGAGVGRRGDHAVETKEMVDPHAVVAKGLDVTDELDRTIGIAAEADEGGEPIHASPLLLSRTLIPRGS
jgi:hypothetical protein